MKTLMPILATGLLGLAAIGVTTAISQDGSEQVRTMIPDKPATMPPAKREVGKPLRARNLKFSDQRRGPRGPRGPRGNVGPAGAPGPAGAQGPAGANGSAALKTYVGSLRALTDYDGTTLGCPAGKAVNGGFASDSAATLLNGSAPTADGLGWTIEVTYIGNTSALWEAYVICMT